LKLLIGIIIVSIETKMANHRSLTGEATSDGGAPGPSRLRRGRGRPATFDSVQAEQAALELLWRDGVHHSGMRALADAMGIGASSIAHAFGTKGDLLARVAERYRLSVAAAVLGPLSESDGQAALERFFMAHARWLSSGLGGCFLLSLVEDPSTDASARAVARQHLDAMRQGLARAVSLAKKSRKSNCSEHRTSLLLLAALGMAAASRGGATGNSIHSMSEAVIAEIRGWDWA